MPFTGSHPAVVLPLLGRGVPASALVIGALVPDLPYYLPLPVPSATTHSLTGVVGVDLLFGLAVFLIWHLVLVPQLLWIAPAALQQGIPASLRTGGRITGAAGPGGADHQPEAHQAEGSAPLDGPVAPVAPVLRWGVFGGLLVLAAVAGLRGALQASAALPALSGPVAVAVAVAVAGIVGFCSTLAVGLLVAAAGWHVAAAHGVVRGAGPGGRR